MAHLQDLFKKIDALYTQLEKLKPLKREDEERLWKKFRLEWNYNSNHIEGSTLTYKQTELLLIFEKTTGDHDMREYEEMKAHDVALRMVTEFAKDLSREITEADIREINKIILVRPFWSNAQTPDGQPTRKLIQPGEYKKEPNSVLLQNGEMFHYASPEDTPVMMKELLEWYSDAVRQSKLHPVEIAALIHYKFVRIHPFDDSNGRTSRLLMNYVLLRYGYPPVIIKSADKKNYLNALNKADVGDVNAFVEYVGEQLVWSLEISLKAGKGQGIEEIDDVDKEIDLYKKEFPRELKNAIPKSANVIRDLVDGSLTKLFETLVMDQLKIDQMFTKSSVSVEFENKNHVLRTGSAFSSAIHEIVDQMEVTGIDSALQNFISIRFDRHNLIVGSKQISLGRSIHIKLQNLSYEIVSNGVTSLKKKYPEQLTDEEIRNFSKKTLAVTFEELKLNNK